MCDLDHIPNLFAGGLGPLVADAGVEVRQDDPRVTGFEDMRTMIREKPALSSHLAAAAPIAADDIAVAMFAHGSKVVARHHTAIADEHHALEPEELLKVIAQLGDRLGIAPIAVKDMESDRPAIDHNEADQHLRIARLAVRLWPLAPFSGGPWPSK